MYSKLTMKEWMALSCATKDVNDFFRKALRENDEPMAVLSLAELIKRGDIDLVAYGIREATDAGYFTLGSHFVTVFMNALTKYGDRDPMLRRISKNIRELGFWPRTSRELLDGTNLTSPTIERGPGHRLEKFLEGFMDGGWYSVEVGLFVLGSEWDYHTKETVPANVGERYFLVFRDGYLLDGGEDIPNILGVLDAAGIKDALPTFKGNELDLYTLSDEGKWVSSKEAKEDTFFYVSYYSIL